MSADAAAAAADNAGSAADRSVFANELYARGSRNFVLHNYADAADELSEVCSLYAEMYGDKSDELGMPYLLYAKSLIALAQQGENKLIDVPEEEEDDDDEDDDGEEDDDADAADDEVKASTSDSTKPTTTNGTNGSLTNGSGGALSLDQPGSSTAPAPPQSDAAAQDAGTTTPTEDEDAANLQVAWEVLELAVSIFQRQGDSAAANLADAYFELAEISLEDVHFETALRDYSKYFFIYFN